ncbi:MAG: carbohydrate binding family 9 domain-containing protein [Gemmatimonadetes bacterium]|nr:carbohydrate binding family 9 domain-containing protein [Gemmatimonadota bacterium]
MTSTGPRTRYARGWYLVAGLALWSTGPAGAQEHNPPTLTVARLPRGTTVRIDGQLSEEFWRTAPTTGGFRQREPVVGDPAREETVVQVALDDHTVYVGITARDSRPDAIVARKLQRDQAVRVSGFEPGLRYGGDDIVAILLDPFHDRRSAYVFAANANGAEFDALVSNDGNEMNADWRGVFSVAAHRSGDGWSVEFAIPLRSIRYPSDSTAIWGFNVVRYHARLNEESLWTSWGRDPEGFHRVSNAGHLIGIGALPRAGLNLEVKPYLLGGGTREVEGAAVTTDGRLEAGLDLKTEVTPGLLLDLTANTDFAQAEVDDERINLTRFSLFFPEKRDFFLENAGIFEFGYRSSFEPPPFLMFFSRRIGVADDGPVPLLGGLRLTGRAGRHSVGVLNVVTEPAFGVPRQNHAVARVKRDLSTGGYVGAMVTDQRSGADWNTAGGVDFLVRPKPTLLFQGYAARTDAKGTQGGFSGRLAGQYQTDAVGAEFAHLIVDSHARADLGFVTRNDIRRTDGNVRYSVRPKLLGLRRLDFFMFGQLVTDGGGRTLERTISPNLNPEWNSGESIFSWYTDGFTRLEEGFVLSDSVPVPAGDYHTWSFNWFANTSPRRPIVLRFNGSLQGLYHGRIDSYGLELSATPSPNVSLTVGANRSLVDLPGGSFTADLASVRLTVAASTKLVANVLAQYNAFERDLGMNIRIGYTFRPGSDLFLVFNERRGDQFRLWAPRERAGLLKLTYLSRL